MAKNTSREFATMDEHERREFAEKPARDSADAPRGELELDNPRNADTMGRHLMEDDPEQVEQKVTEMEESGAVTGDARPERRRAARRETDRREHGQ
ncbi:MAG TPA: hypothetical protein VFW66_07295 [Gemmatimonadales bacterium]|nr:hypothetical protein [Gemmatimonadales bacterium]